MSAETIARLHIVLSGIEPVIWRRVDVPVTASLKMLHDIVQTAMGWENYHLWHFEAGGLRHGLLNPMWPDSGMAAATNVKLAALRDRGIRELLYTYDNLSIARRSIAVWSSTVPSARTIEHLAAKSGEPSSM
ncbi:plasmid pRiA4b ORF-3 family protein [Sphingomonas solaris]|uniref:Plasmid pRiA4b ORF-3 family protein n=2 Tax=Alterirhizorhabdus solaris TaxID=2529389 RepID=A0A558QST0_9SPHN|nr:plasmid pRiA4b ORF-3 family protein [Sphingomonas solaris]